MVPNKVIITAALILAFPAHAQDGGLPKDVVDGSSVTLEEVRQNSRKVFESFAGKDGGPVSRDEFVSTDLPPDIVPSKPDRKTLGKLFQVLDSDGNDLLSRNEWNAQIEKDLDFADENEDGRITMKELSNARKNIDFGDAIGMIF